MFRRKTCVVSGGNEVWELMRQRLQNDLAHAINGRLFYGWVMLAVAGVALFASGPGQSHIFSVFITPISQDLGLSRTSISSAYAAATLVAALGLPYVGRLVDRYGVRRVLLVVAVLFGASAMAFGTVTNMIALAIGFAALRFLGQGSLMLNCANLVAQWFSKKRGFALSLMDFGFSASMAVHPPLAQWLIDHVGWRSAWLWLGLMTWVLLIPLIVILIQNKPEDLGLLPDGRRRDDDLGQGPATPNADSADVGLTVKQAVRTPAFWIIAMTLATFSAVVTGLFFHQVSIFENAGLSPQVAAWTFSISAIVMVLTMPILGHMLDRLPTQPMLAAATLTMTLVLLCLVFVRDIPSAIVYSVAFGINNAAIHTHMSFLWPRFFGRRYLGSIQGTATTIGVIGASIGPLPLGIAFDMFGSYTGALIVLAILPMLCATAVLLMEPPRLEDYTATRTA